MQISDLLAAAAGNPWLLVAALLTAATAVLTRVRLLTWRQRRLHDGARLLTIAVPAEVDPAGAAVFWTTAAGLLRSTGWRRLLHGPSHLAMEYLWSGRQMTIRLWLPGTVPARLAEAAVAAAWPGAGVTAASDDTTPPLPVHAAAAGGAMWPALAQELPLRDDHDTDPMRPLLALGATLRPGQHLAVQVLARPAPRRRAAAAAAAPDRMRQPGTQRRGLLDPGLLLNGVLDLFLPSSGTPRSGPPPRRADPAADRDARAALDKTGHPLWETAVRYGVADATTRGPDRVPQLRSLAKGVAAAFGVHTGRNRLRPVRLRRPAAVLAGRVLRRGFLASTPELAALAGLPLDLAVAGLDRAGARPVPAPVSVPSGGRGTKPLGRDPGGHAVALPVADARHHLHMLGATGSGKSTLLANLVLDDITAGRGVVVIDPKGDLVTDLLDRLPATAAQCMVLIDPAQPANPALNPLQGDDADLVVDNIVSIFSKIFQRHWGPRIDDVLRVSCHTLLRHAGATLTLVPPLLQDKQFRAGFTHDLDDPEGLRGFWDWYESTPPPVRAQVIGPVLARLRSFLLRDFVKQTLGTPRSSFDMADVLNGGILLARLPKGVLGEETTRLLGSFVLASAWQAATARANLPEQQRRDCTVVIDECHNFLTLPRSVDDMLAEARGYRLSMVLAHQHLAQLPRETLAALSANARNKVFFACAPEDAKVLARHTAPHLGEHDLASLGAYTAATRLVVDARETPAFTLHTRPPRPPVGESTALRAACAAALDIPTGAPRGVHARARRNRPTPSTSSTNAERQP